MTSTRGRLAAILLLILVSVTGGAIAFSSAWAQDGDEEPTTSSLALFGFVEGEDGETGYFQGTASNLVASESNGDILLDGVIDGLITGEDEATRIAGLTFSSVVEPSVVGAVSADDTGEDGTPEGSADQDSLAFAAQPTTEDGCDVLYLQTEPISLGATEPEMVTAPITVDAASGDDALAELVCSLGTLLDESPDDTAGAVDLLNQILGGVGGTDEVTVETAEATEEVTEEATDEGTEEATEEATEEDGEATEEATEEDEDNGDDEEEPTEESTKPVLSPGDDDATPGND
jgi:hypothetical protein